MQTDRDSAYNNDKKRKKMGVRSGPRIPSRGSEFELIKGGTFEVATDITDYWTAFTSTTLSLQSSGSPGNCMRTLSGSGVRGGAYQDIGTTVGQVYKIIVHMNKGTSGTVAYFVGTTGSERTLIGASYETDSTASGWTRHENEFTASATTTRVSVVSRDSVSTDYSEFDMVSVKPVDSPLILCLDAGLNRSTSAMADAGHPTDNEGIEEDYQPTGCKLITRADKTILQGQDLRPYDSNGYANWTGAVTGGGAYFTKVSGSSASLFYGYMSTSYGYTSNPVVGRRYRIVVRAKTNTGGGYLRTYDGAGGYPLITTSVDTTMKTYTFDFTCQHATGCFIYGNASYADGQILYFDRYEVYELTPWLDVSGRGNNATPELGINGLTIESGTDKRGQGLKYFDFDGTDDKISVPHNSDFTAAKTWACWFNLDVIPISSTFDNLFSSTDNWNQAGGISMQFIYGSFTWSWGSSWGGACQIAHSTLSTGTWYHVVGTSDGTTGTDKVKMYLNGELKDTGTASQIPDDTNPNSTAKIYIGSGNGGSVNGQIAAFQVYTAELTHAHVKQIYNSQRSRFGL